MVMPVVPVPAAVVMLVAGIAVMLVAAGCG
jgi:hypothetical protein